MEFVRLVMPQGVLVHQEGFQYLVLLDPSLTQLISQKAETIVHCWQGDVEKLGQAYW